MSLDSLLDSLTRGLSELAGAHDRSGAWPAQSLEIAGRHGVWQWAIPEAYGGQPRDGTDRLAGYEALAAGCLATTLIVTQQHSACELIAGGDNEALRAALLPRLAAGATHCTLGISHLTTSRRGGARQMMADAAGNGFVLNGRMPWSTGPAYCEHVVTGAILADGRQLLACLPLSAPGVTIGPPLKLAALHQTHTTWVDCQGVAVQPDWIVRGPADNVLARRSTIRPLTVSAVALGLAQALIRAMQSGLPEDAAEFTPLVTRFEQRHRELRRQLHATIGAEKASEEHSASAIRGRLNDLVQRLAGACMTLAKGHGYLLDHPAQRLCREALFLLVWSAPVEVQRQTLEQLLAGWPGEPHSG